MSKTDVIEDAEIVTDAAVVPIKAQQVPETTPATLLEMAVSQNADMDKIEKLMELQLRWEANEAKKAFNEAFANFAKESPAIVKDKDNKQYGSKYASIGSLVNTATPILGKHGLSARWVPEQDGEIIKMTCILSHISGHSESAAMTAPPDKSGSKNPIQQVKSAGTYLRVATFEAVTGLASVDEKADDDGNSYGVECINVDQAQEIKDYLESTRSDKKKFLAVYKIQIVDELPANKYKTVITMLKRKAGES